MVQSIEVSKKVFQPIVAVLVKSGVMERPAANIIGHC